MEVDDEEIHVAAGRETGERFGSAEIGADLVAARLEDTPEEAKLDRVVVDRDDASGDAHATALPARTASIARSSSSTAAPSRTTLSP